MIQYYVFLMCFFKISRLQISISSIKIFGVVSLFSTFCRWFIFLVFIFNFKFNFVFDSFFWYYEVCHLIVSLKFILCLPKKQLGVSLNYICIFYFVPSALSESESNIKLFDNLYCWLGYTIIFYKLFPWVLVTDVENTNFLFLSRNHVGSEFCFVFLERESALKPKNPKKHSQWDLRWKYEQNYSYKYFVLHFCSLCYLQLL